MTAKTRTHKTRTHNTLNTLILLASCLGVGVFATAAAQAARPDVGETAQPTRALAAGERWWRATPGLDLARKLKDWRPTVTWQDSTEGFNLARPFGKRGPTIQCSSSLPVSVRSSLNAGAGARPGVVDIDTDVFLFLQKRW